ncbi:PglZ domain-containing protein [Alicyclobacillus tolerans]|uniref:PglZ domain-containing protein n=1 Tax=Alicyclobacillus tolerans TaxID=90970 RepID=UPI001F37006C|nr:PglZ domain-containing protein [Alicyclobacillus tolerans]MCF8567888.1 PglZ domain-containing protein [Alicyclobacillus tolerans]
MTIVDAETLDRSQPIIKQLPAGTQLIVVPDGSIRHVIEATMTDYRWVTISVGEIFNRLSNDIVKSVPIKYWDRLFDLHSSVKSPLTQEESALLVARGVYGIDPLFIVDHIGLMKILVDVALSEEGLPQMVSSVIHSLLPATIKDTMSSDFLSNPAKAKDTLHRIRNSNLDELGLLQPSLEIMLQILDQGTDVFQLYSGPPDHFAELLNDNVTPSEFVQYGLRYCAALSADKVSMNIAVASNEIALRWLQSNYALVLRSANPNVLKLTTLVSNLNSQIGETPLLFIVIDGMGLQAWNVVQSVWSKHYGIHVTRSTAAFAVLPTITSLSRRAIFEGKVPANFTNTKHSARLERKLWVSKFGSDGSYFASDEISGILDAFALGKRRICVVDVTWDDRSHKIKPPFDSINHAAGFWASQTRVLQVVKQGLDSGYRVILTADHGQVQCQGQGRPDYGELTGERSKRVILFKNKALRDSYIDEDSFAFDPTGVSSDCWPLFSTQLNSFDHKGSLSVSHGGLSLEEVLVPVVEVGYSERKNSNWI